jgi:Skp family chaperone for outer membrane proteins
MKRTLVLALAAGLATSTLAAQTAPAPAPAAAATAPAVAPPPQAVPAKIAIIAFQSGMLNTNEGARTVDSIQKKYAPQKVKIDAENGELESLRKQLAAIPATASSDDQRAKLTIDIDTKEKQLNLDGESAQTSYNTDLQKAFGELQQKFGTAAVKYCNDNGFTMLVTPESAQNSPNPILWWTPTIDITQAVINAYNASSGVAAPPPSAPGARPRPSAPHAGTTAPHATTPAPKN